MCFTSWVLCYVLTYKSNKASIKKREETGCKSNEQKRVQCGGSGGAGVINKIKTESHESGVL